MTPRLDMTDPRARQMRAMVARAAKLGGKIEIGGVAYDPHDYLDWIDGGDSAGAREIDQMMNRGQGKKEHRGG